jgi:hypothetical protein
MRKRKARSNFYAAGPIFGSFARAARRPGGLRFGSLNHAQDQGINGQTACPLLEGERTCGGHREIDAIDPNVWSGRASQEVFVELAVSGLASMYPASGWSSLGSGPSWKSARLRSH